jgi:hypothetical protein
MASITEIADTFFVACETGKGWEGCRPYCTPNATFSAHTEPLADVKQYCDWMKSILGPIPDGRYELISFATDEQRHNVSPYAVFHGTNTGEGGPLAPTALGGFDSWLHWNKCLCQTLSPQAGSRPARPGDTLRGRLNPARGVPLRVLCRRQRERQAHAGSRKDAALDQVIEITSEVRQKAKPQAQL